MEDPRKEIEHVVRQLVTRPSLEQQAETLRKYFSPGVCFYHYIINVVGLKELTAIYQFAEIAFNYQGVQFRHVAYDAETDLVTLHMLVSVRPFFRLWTEGKLEFLTLLELEDFEPDPYDNIKITEDGMLDLNKKSKVLKKIKVQRDFFERDPFLVGIPIIGDIYNATALRFLIGFLQANLFQIGWEITTALLPSWILKPVVGFLSDSPIWSSPKKFGKTDYDV